jgi:hypothetical protein
MIPLGTGQIAIGIGRREFIAALGGAAVSINPTVAGAIAMGDNPSFLGAAKPASCDGRSFQID